MCNGSRATKTSKDARVGQTLGVSTVALHDNRGKIGAFHTHGQATTECVQCIQTGQKLTLFNIPLAIQKKFGLKQTEVVTFKQGAAWHQDDQLVCERNDRAVPLKTFADQDISVYVGIRTPDIDKVVDQIEQDALISATAKPWIAPADRVLVTAR